MSEFDRKFDTWEFYDPAIVQKTLKFDVRVTGPVNKAEGPVEYYIESEQPQVSARATTFEALRQQLIKQLRAWYAIRWEPRICVLIVTGSSRSWRITEDDSTFKPEVRITYFEHGFLEKDPNVVYNRASGDSAVKQGAYQPSVYGDVAHWVIVPNTPEALAVINGIAKDLERFTGEALVKLEAFGKWENANIGAVTLADATRGR